MIGVAPAVAPMAANAMVQEIGQPVGLGAYGNMPQACAGPSAYATPQQISAALRIPQVRKEVVSLLYDAERQITRLDPDIAVHRSFSTAAKIVYQRQRNVDVRLKDMDTPSSWYDRLHGILLKRLGGF